METIKLSEKTKQFLQNLIQLRNDADAKIQLILQTVLNEHNVDGDYEFDVQKFELVKKE